MESITKKLSEQAADRFLANLEGPIPKKSLSVFEPWMLDTIIEVGSRGGSVTRMALLCGVTPSTLKKWSDKSSPDRIEAVSEAVEVGRGMALLFFEEIGLNAANGLIKNHAGSTYQFLMKNMFRDQYRDETVQKHEGNVKLKISPDMDPVLASQKYRDLLAAENEPSFDDFIGE